VNHIQSVVTLQKIFFVCSLLILVISSTSCTTKHYTKKLYAKAQQEKPFDVIIVPGVPYEGKDTTPVMKMRLFWAKNLYDSGFTHNIIFSGSAVYSPYVEGIIMKIMADSLGIPPDHSFSETRAEHSTENVYYSWLMAKEMGYKKIALATDPFQSKLLRRFMKQYCPGVKAIPIVLGTMDINSKSLPDIDASSARRDNFVSIMERESFFTRFRYTLGKRVKDEVKKARRAEK
jgi:uncharacterized SAM-binding protein YcdF (DUF218 family)